MSASRLHLERDLNRLSVGEKRFLLPCYKPDALALLIACPAVKIRQRHHCSANDHIARGSGKQAGEVGAERSAFFQSSEIGQKYCARAAPISTDHIVRRQILLGLQQIGAAFEADRTAARTGLSGAASASRSWPRTISSGLRPSSTASASSCTAICASRLRKRRAGRLIFGLALRQFQLLDTSPRLERNVNTIDQSQRALLSTLWQCPTVCRGCAD